MNADEFNARYPVGTPVLAYPGIRPEHPVAVAFQKRANDGRSFGDKDPCKRLVTRTRTPAWPLGHGEPVVSVDGYPGGIVLEHVDVISEEQFAKARAEETAAAVAAQGALSVPVGDQPQPLDDARLAEIREHLAATTTWSIGNLAARDLLAEVERLKAQRTFLLNQIRIKDARSGEADRAVRQFLRGEEA